MKNEEKIQTTLETIRVYEDAESSMIIKNSELGIRNKFAQPDKYPTPKQPYLGSAIHYARKKWHRADRQRLFIVLNLSSLLYNLITLIAMTVRDRTCSGIGFHKRWAHTIIPKPITQCVRAYLRRIPTTTTTNTSRASVRQQAKEVTSDGWKERQKTRRQPAKTNDSNKTTRKVQNVDARARANQRSKFAGKKKASGLVVVVVFVHCEFCWLSFAAPATFSTRTGDSRRSHNLIEINILNDSLVQFTIAQIEQTMKEKKMATKLTRKS